MRWLAPSLVVLGLVFSTGGVAIVGRADPSANGKLETKQSAAPAENGTPVTDLPGECAAPTPAPRASQAATSRPREARGASANESIVLNTSGYNYSIEGEWHPDPAATPQGVPTGVLPQELEAAPVVAPEAK